MKKRNYEKYYIIYFLLLCFIFEIIFIAFLFKKKINYYDVLSGVYIKDNYIEFIISNKELKKIQENSVFIYKNKKYYYSIESIESDAFITNGVTYNTLIIKTDKINALYNEVINVSLFSKKVKVIDIFKIIWKGDFL